MNWDWDKLQEKRQRQNWGNSSNNSSNNNNNNKNDEEPPFGSGSGNGGGKGPDYEKFSDAFKRLPHLSAPAGGKVKWILVALVAVWLLSGIYIVNPDEEGVVLRFGKYDRTVGAGPHYALPFPIETVYKPKVTQVQRVEVGFRSVGQGRTFQQGANRSLPEESGMLTGDENIVNVQFSVQYQIKNPVEYLFNVTDQAAVVKNAAEAAMREVIGNSLIDSALTDGKLQIQTEATQLLQEILDRYKVGVRVIAVQLQDVHPAKDVTKQRMYLEAMEEILSRPGMEKLVLPKDAADRVLPLLPLMQSAPSAGKIAPQEQPSGTQLPEATLSRPRGNN